MRCDEMTSFFPHKRAMVGTYCALQMVILQADICAHLLFHCGKCVTGIKIY